MTFQAAESGDILRVENEARQENVNDKGKKANCESIGLGKMGHSALRWGVNSDSLLHLSMI